MHLSIACFFACLASIATAQARVPVFQNTCPAQLQSDPAYLRGLASLRSAIQNGARIHASMALPENGGTSWFFVEVTAVKIVADYASALIPVRSPIDNSARVTQSNGLVAGSFDTLGNYVYGQYLFGSDTLGSSFAPAVKTTTYSCYVISWYAD